MKKGRIRRLQQYLMIQTLISMEWWTKLRGAVTIIHDLHMDGSQRQDGLSWGGSNYYSRFTHRWSAKTSRTTRADSHWPGLSYNTVTVIL